MPKSFLIKKASSASSSAKKPPARCTSGCGFQKTAPTEGPCDLEEISLTPPSSSTVTRDAVRQDAEKMSKPKRRRTKRDSSERRPITDDVCEEQAQGENVVSEMSTKKSPVESGHKVSDATQKRQHAQAVSTSTRGRMKRSSSERQPITDDVHGEPRDDEGVATEISQDGSPVEQGTHQDLANRKASKYNVMVHEPRRLRSSLRVSRITPKPTTGSQNDSEANNTDEKDPETCLEHEVKDDKEKNEKDTSTYVCSICGKGYATSSNLSRHKQTHRSLDSKQAKACGYCGKRYVSMPALSMHVLTHTRSHECHVCGKRFSRPWLLQGHIRSHTGERPFRCRQCNKSFADRSNLRAHEQTHSLLKQFHCERCNRSFALKSYLTKHLEATCLAEEKP